MAYGRRGAGRRSYGSGRSRGYTARGRTSGRGGGGGRKRATGRRAGGGTMKLQIEVVPASGVSRAINPAQVAGALPRRARY